MENVLVAMSGGVDSSVAAFLLKEQGFELVGAMMKLFEGDGVAQSGCCSAADASDARGVATRLGIPFYAFNFMDTFQSQVIDRFVSAYSQGATPNPCIDCNRFLKFERFLRRATEIGCGKIATGHYARISRQGSRYLLKKGLDTGKDQSYALYSMNSDQLARTFFPLGELPKAKVREIAAAEGFANAKKPDSQDICFAPDGDYAGFISRHTGLPPTPGPFKGRGGEVLGEHKGIINYTIGQRRGIGISAPHPLYVTGLAPKDNTVFLGGESELYAKTLTAGDINLIAVESIPSPLRVFAKIRYNQKEQPAKVWQTAPDTLRVEFDQPQRAITRGQAVVLYDGETVIGGGTITGVEKEH